MKSENIYFIRSIATFDLATYYETHTDVWVFGDVAGYTYIRTILRNAKGADKAIRLNAITRESYSMRVAVLPANRELKVQPRVKLIERVIHDSDRPNMELIIYGNCPGYDRLADLFDRAINDPGDPSNHEHIDDTPCPGRWVVPRSVSLNVRRPLAMWDINNLAPYSSHITYQQAAFLPADGPAPLFLPERYVPIVPEECVYLRLV